MGRSRRESKPAAKKTQSGERNLTIREQASVFDGELGENVLAPAEQAKGPAAGVGSGQQASETDVRNKQRRLSIGGGTAQLPSGASRSGSTPRGGIRIGGL
jgi:hypothetical protein